MKDEELVKLAQKARENSYSPYSNFKVGCALLTKSGKVFLGANIENSAYGVCICAERSAICSAISNGEKNFERLAVVGDEKDYCYPCGVCRQVLSELASDITVVCAKNATEFKSYKIEELLPHSFSLN